MSVVVMVVVVVVVMTFMAVLMVMLIVVVMPGFTIEAEQQGRRYGTPLHRQHLHPWP
jgi:hypothetical protein